MEESFRGVLEARGFGEALFRVSPPPEHEEIAGEGWADWVRDNAKNFRRPTIEQIDSVVKPIWEELVAHARYADERLTQIFREEVRPDAIVSDNVCAFPAVYTAGVPWIRAVSANRLELRDPDLPPPMSGYPVGDRVAWDEFRRVARASVAGVRGELQAFLSESGLGPLPEDEFQYESPWLNYYLFPGPVDYQRSRPLGSTWHRLDSTVRVAFYLGLPTIVLPLFWDQYDNAQRAQETGFGVRLRTHDFEDHEFLDGVNRLLGDSPLTARLSAISVGLRANPGRTLGANLVEGLVRSAQASHA